VKVPDVPVRNPIAVLREEFDDWAILFNPDTADAYGINPVGVAIWKQIDGRKTQAEIALAAANQFAGVPETITGDVAVFLRELAEIGFVGHDVGP
jgi:SynChlorMet cassette protein ScmD